MKFEIKEFIGVFENALSQEDCKSIINTFELLKQSRATFNRTQFDSDQYIFKDGELTFFSDEYIDDINLRELAKNNVRSFQEAVWRCYNLYSQKYGVLTSLTKHTFTSTLKVQKISPTQGYHVWHCEHGSIKEGTRLLLVLGYLNDVYDGGETEFLYQSRRIKPKQGTILICPSGFTHTHRGNPPLEGVKYVMNGWIEYTE